MAATLGATPLFADDSKAPAQDAATQEDPAFVVGPELTKVPLEEIEKAYEGKTAPEAIRMYLAIAKGSLMGPGEGWFGPAKARYGGPGWRRNTESKAMTGSPRIAFMDHRSTLPGSIAIETEKSHLKITTGQNVIRGFSRPIWRIACFAKSTPTAMDG